MQRESRVRSITMSVFVLVVAGALAGPASVAQDNTRQQMRSLDDQVQEIKTDVLTIGRDLALLEERLLYPSNTQLSVFVEMAAEDSFRLDAVRIEIDGSAVAHHIYTFKELEALQSGGVQRIYTGNVTTGAHDIAVTVNGKLANGDDFSSQESFSFSKDVDPKLIGLILAGQGRSADIELNNW